MLDWPFFDPARGGDPILWQHLFWIFGHPDVYIMFVPAVGIVSHIVQTFSRRPLVGYPFVVLGIISVGFLSFGLWVHHMFTTGLPQTAMGFFTAASMMIAIPSGVQVFCWIATIWTGRPMWRTPLLFVAGFIAIFTLGGLTGVMTASVPFDAQVHDSYFVVAHFHYVMVGGVVFPLIAGLYYWLPKITGRLLSERLGRWNFWVMFVFFNVAFFPMHLSGMWGMPRRVYTYPAGLGWELPNLISTIGALGFAVGVLLFVVNFLWSLRRGEEAGMDPWGGDSLEWSQGSPPAEAQFQSLPAVRSRHPLWEQDSLAAETPAIRRVLDAFAWKPLDFRGALVVSMVEARPLAIVHVPGPTLWPFVMSVAFLFIFAAALFDHLLAFLFGAGLTLVALVGWFSPRPSEDAAVAQFSTAPDADPVPLALAGPMANGWWGTIVFLLIMATALACTIASFFYLGGHDAGAPTAGSWPATLGALAGLGAAVAMVVAGGARPAQDARYSR
ncbi:MAG: cytochrome c oxidase subunit I, partial [Longimicrobiales bacterium]